MLELTEQEPPQSETTSYEKEIPQLLVGSTQVIVNEDTPTSVTIMLVGGGGGPVGGLKVSRPLSHCDAIYLLLAMNQCQSE